MAGCHHARLTARHGAFGSVLGWHIDCADCGAYLWFSDHLHATDWPRIQARLDAVFGGSIAVRVRAMLPPDVTARAS